MYDFCVKSDDYKTRYNELTTSNLHKHAMELRKEAKNALFYNKIGGALISLIPGIDYLVQKFYIKKDAMKKVGKIFGINVEFINDSKNNQNNKNHKEMLKEVNGESIEINSSSKIMDGLQTTGKVGGYYQGTKNILDSIKMTDQANIMASNFAFLGEKGVQTSVKLMEKANLYKKEAEIAEIFSNIHVTPLDYIYNPYATKAAELTAKSQKLLSESTAIHSKIASLSKQATDLSSKAKGLSVIGKSVSIGTCFLSVALGAYFTHQFCEELLDKFVDFYINNATYIFNSLEQASQYLLKKSKL